MEPAYRPEQWHDLFTMIGAAAGSLVGLLFVVISLHVERITERTDVNMRVTVEGARNNTLHLLTVLLEAAAVLTPQPPLFLGAELIAMNLFGLRLPLIIVRKYFGAPITISERGGFPMSLIVTIVLAYLLGIAGGAAAAANADWALYLVAASCLVKLVRTVLTAWMLAFGMFNAPPPKG
jgi:hypothetical protein